jgi:hypothetical protein
MDVTDVLVVAAGPTDLRSRPSRTRTERPSV